MSLEHTNSLAVVYLTTKFEYDTGAVHKSIENYLSHEPSIQHKFDLVVFFDQGEESDYEDLTSFAEHENVNSIKLVSWRIPDKDNIYVPHQHHRLKKFYKIGAPELGFSSGPNMLFFNSLEQLCIGEYDYCLVLETDTYARKTGWFDLLAEYCDNNDFLIAGSIYKGNLPFPRNCKWKKHLNGVAIYRTGADLGKLLLSSKEYIIQFIKDRRGRCFLNYDLAMHYYVKSSEGVEYRTEDSPKLWLRDTDIIVNMSPSTDASITEQEIEERFPHAIIVHQKEKQ
jgi:hypothetical protein